MASYKATVKRVDAAKAETMMFVTVIVRYC